MLTAVLLAERAALGALLLHAGEDPSERTVLRWLRPGDFGDPWHREVYTTIRDHAASAKSFDAHTVGLRLIERLGHSRADVVRLTGLLHATPARPEPGLYAGMVLDAGLRREVFALGVLLRAGALSAVLDRTPRPLLGVAAAVDTRIDAVERRWRYAQLPVTPAAEPVARTSGLGRRMAGTDARLGADRLLSAHPMPTAGHIAEREADLVAALVARPAAIADVRDWLRPEAITNDAWRPVYAATLALARRGDAIDPVTVLWEAGRTPGGEAASVAQVLARVEAVLPRHPGALARDVAADHLRLGADAAATALQAAAADLTRDFVDVLDVARTQTAAVRTAGRPLATAPLRVASVTRAIAPTTPTRTLEAG
ncbi:MAG: DnaB-like helicase N-terminal domain-containing protein [Sporichthyaceae bacterium]